MDSRKNDTNTQSQPEWFEALNRAILESALDCIITMDADGRVLEFNPAAEKLFGFKREEAVGRELAELIIPPSLRERHRQGLKHYLETGEGPVLGRRIEIAAVRAGGSEFLVELAITAFRVHDRPVFTAYLRDITERVRTERRRTAQYNVATLLAGSGSLSETAPQIIQTIAASGNWVVGALWLHDPAEMTLHCEATWHADSPGAAEFAKLTHEIELSVARSLPGQVVLGRKAKWITDLTNEKTFPRAAAARGLGLHGAFLFPLIAEGEVLGIIELYSHESSPPDEDLVQLSAALGSQIALFIHRRRVEQELKRQKEAAEAASAAKDRFLATLSHELRTPLTPVLMWSGSMLDQPGVPVEVNEGLRMISRNIELEARLIDDLLDLTRISRGKLQLNIRRTDVHDLLRHAADIVSGDVRARHLTLDLHLDARHTFLAGDPSRLQQVFWNILSNACKFTSNFGAISVRTSDRNEGLRVEISDNGSGIAPGDLDRIFDAFEQVGPRPAGLGVGLAISKAIIELHGGTIRASSPGLGKGATFAMDFPSALPARQSASQ